MALSDETTTMAIARENETMVGDTDRCLPFRYGHDLLGDYGMTSWIGVYRTVMKSISRL